MNSTIKGLAGHFTKPAAFLLAGTACSYFTSHGLGFAPALASALSAGAAVMASYFSNRFTSAYTDVEASLNVDVNHDIEKAIKEAWNHALSDRLDNIVIAISAGDKGAIHFYRQIAPEGVLDDSIVSAILQREVFEPLTIFFYSDEEALRIINDSTIISLEAVLPAILERFKLSQPWDSESYSYFDRVIAHELAIKFKEKFIQQVKANQKAFAAYSLKLLESTHAVVCKIDVNLEIIKEWIFNNFNTTPRVIVEKDAALTADFIGRQKELLEVHSLISAGPVAITGDGGIGKTTLALKYWEHHQNSYKHFIWLFCGQGINEAILNYLPDRLGIAGLISNQNDTKTNLRLIRDKLTNIPECLIVLDHVRDTQDFASFHEVFGGIRCRLLVTTRADLHFIKMYPVPALSYTEAADLFSRYCPGIGKDTDQLLHSVFKAISYNTLLIEVFSKNLDKLSKSRLGDVDSFVHDLGANGLFLHNNDFTVKVETGTRVATVSEILEALYDLDSLSPSQEDTLVALALLPAESYTLGFLIDIVQPSDRREFLRIIGHLSGTGWINTYNGGSSIKLSPLLQSILIRKKSSAVDRLAIPVISVLNQKLRTEGSFLLVYTSDTPRYVSIAAHVIDVHQGYSVGMCRLCDELVQYYFNIGDIISATTYADNMYLQASKAADDYNTAQALFNLGRIRSFSGGYQAAFDLYVQGTALLSDLNEVAALESGLMMLYANLTFKVGGAYDIQGNREQALVYYQKGISILEGGKGNDTEVQFRLAIMYGDLGAYFLDRAIAGEISFDQSKEYLWHSMKLFEELPVSIKAKLIYRRNIVATAMSIELYYLYTYQFLLAESKAVEVLNVFEILCREYPGIFDFKYSLILAISNLCQVKLNIYGVADEDAEKTLKNMIEEMISEYPQAEELKIVQRIKAGELLPPGALDMLRVMRSKEGSTET